MKRHKKHTNLSRHFETFPVTIRKDLDVLQAHGTIHRTHGGALSCRDGATEDPTLREKGKLHRREKLRIADIAASIMKEGQVIILDSGTTTTGTRALRSFQNLTVITNVLNIAAELAGTAVEVIRRLGDCRCRKLLYEIKLRQGRRRDRTNHAMLTARKLLILGSARRAKKAPLPDSLYVYCTEIFFARSLADTTQRLQYSTDWPGRIEKSTKLPAIP